MTAQVHIPSMLRRLYGTQPVESVEAANVTEMAQALDQRFPGMLDRHPRTGRQRAALC